MSKKNKNKVVRRKTKPNSLESKKKPWVEYTYEKLEDFFNVEKDRINAFASILSCSSPYKSGCGKYICVAKLIDKTVNPKLPFTQYISASFFSRNIQDIPAPTKIGSIVRIHRGETKKYKGRYGVFRYQLNCDTDIKAAWVLFDPEESLESIAKSSKKYTTSENSLTIFKGIRSWSKEFFKDYELQRTSLCKAKEKAMKDFNPTCLILEAKYKDNNIVFKVCDDTGVANLKTVKGMFSSIEQNDIVKIRCASIGKDGNLLMEPYSNILKIPIWNLSVKKLKERMNKAENLKGLLQFYIPVIDNNICISKIKDCNMSHSSIQQLFNLSVSKGKFRIKAEVIGTYPSNSKDWLFVYDKTNNKLLKVEEIFENDKEELPINMEYAFFVKFFIIDKTTTDITSAKIITLFTAKNKGKEFINIGLGKEKPLKIHYKKLKVIQKWVSKLWIVLDIIIEIVQEEDRRLYYIVDTELQIPDYFIK